MRRYGSKKASRPYPRIHRVCGQCAGYAQTPMKSGRALEKRRARREISNETLDARLAFE
jgi:hypothetical protein